MNRWLCGLAAAAVCLSVSAAPLKPADDAKAADPEMFVEFSKRPHQNPAQTGPGTVTISGTCGVPSGVKLLGVDVTYKKAENPAFDNSNWTVLHATLDRTVKPVTWTATGTGINPGERYVFRARVSSTGMKPGGTVETESAEWRFLGVK